MIKVKSSYILTVGFGLILLLLLTSSAIGLKSMSEINANMEEIVNTRMAKILHLQKMRYIARERSISLLRFIIKEDPFELDDEQQHFNSLAGGWIKEREELMRLEMDAKTLAMLDNLYKKIREVYTYQREVFELIDIEDKAVANKVALFDRAIMGQDSVLVLQDEIIAYQLELSQKEVALSKADYDHAFIILASITVILMVIGLSIAIYAIRKNNSDVQKIEYYAYHDVLTSLPNRRLLMDRLRIEATHSLRLNKYGAILFVDVDNFKVLNDSLGHRFGDQLIQQIAQRLSNSIRKDDTVARLGGDEFIVLLPPLADSLDEVIQKSENMGHKILSDLSRDYEINGSNRHITVSIGITIIGGEATEPDDLLMQSDVALYSAKDAGRNTIRFFDQTMQEKADKRFEVEQNIKSSLSADRFILHYQPQIDHKGHLTGIEALVRWDHPEKGLLYPVDFIAIAEESGLIVPLGNDVLDKACQFLKSIEQIGMPDSFTSLSVNISPKQFHQHDFCKIVKSKIDQYKVDPSMIKLEITEGMLLSDIDGVIKKMERLKSMSIQFSIDDFGTGYSSLSYLQKLPLDEIKIDQSFVRQMLNNSRSAAIVETIATMANKLDFSLIAEGVEEEQQKAFLASHGCHHYQGYLFDKPLPGNTLIAKYLN